MPRFTQRFTLTGFRRQLNFGLCTGYLSWANLFLIRNYTNWKQHHLDIHWFIFWIEYYNHKKRDDFRIKKLNTSVTDRSKQHKPHHGTIM